MTLHTLVIYSHAFFKVAAGQSEPSLETFQAPDQLTHRIVSSSSSEPGPVKG